MIDNKIKNKEGKIVIKDYAVFIIFYVIYL